jgi:hypothetical protein
MCLRLFTAVLNIFFSSKFVLSLPTVFFERSEDIILAAIRSCKLDTTPAELKKLDIHLYTHQGSLNFIDITSVQAVVGRVPHKAGSTWAIIDRSGALARAIFNNEDGAGNSN